MVCSLPTAQILVVDDDPIVLEVISEQMRDFGYDVRAFGSGAEVLEHLDPGALVSDVSMPGVDGVTLLREVHRRLPGLPALLMTGFAKNVAELEGGGGMPGAFTLLRKPFSGAQLADLVGKLFPTGPGAGQVGGCA